MNVPDVVKVIAVYESLDSSLPTLDKLTFVSGLNLNTASILGEKIIGAESGAVAQVVTRLSQTEVEIVYLNSNKFLVNESVTFEESRVQGIVTTLETPSKSVTTGYTFDTNQQGTFYDQNSGLHQSSRCSCCLETHSGGFSSGRRGCVLCGQRAQISIGQGTHQASCSG